MMQTDRSGGAPRKVLSIQCPSLSFDMSPLPYRLAFHPPSPCSVGPQKLTSLTRESDLSACPLHFCSWPTR